MIELLRRDGQRVLRVGHRLNTLESLEAAARHELDVVEIDVLGARDGAVVLAHSQAGHGLPTLDEALAHLAEHSPGVGIQVDLKSTGYEAAVVEALRRHGALERAFVSSFHPASLRAIAELEPRLPRAVTYPRDRHGLSGRRVLMPAVVSALLVMRRALPYRVDSWLRGARASAATLHWMVISRAAIERCHAHGAAVLAWTVDDPGVSARLTRAGIDGIITNDPRIFDGGVLKT